MSDRSHRLRVDGRTLIVDVSTNGARNVATLWIDGCEAATAVGDEIGRIDLRVEDPPVHVRATFWWTGRVVGVALVERDGRRPLTVPFEPPAGTRAARSFERRRRHPGLYAARHVPSYLAGAAAGVIGVSFGVRFLVGWIDLPDLRAPSWLRWFNPATYVRPVFAWLGERLPDLPDLPTLPPWARFVVGLLVVSVAAVREARRRRQRFDEQDDQDDPDEQNEQDDQDRARQESPDAYGRP